MKTDKEILVVFPYLRTSDPVWIRGFYFKSSNDKSDLNDEIKKSLDEISQMFYLQDDVQITEVMYTHFFLSDDNEENQGVWRRLQQVQMLIGYIYCSPDRSWSTFLHYEHISLFVFRNSWLSKYLLKPSSDPRLKIMSGVGLDESQSLTLDSNLENGYQVTVNWQYEFPVVRGSHIYPPRPDFWLNIHQDLATDLKFGLEYPSSWAFAELVTSSEGKSIELENRIFTSLRWYNQSTSLGLPSDLALVNLAIAFECLLNLQQDKELVKRFKETIVNLLGNVPRLDSWIEQFYKARSAIVHDGSWSHLMYYPANVDQIRDIYLGKKSAMEYLPLISYGWNVFRLCFNLFLSGAELASRYNLGASLIPNQERLENICRVLNNKNQTTEARLNEVSHLIIQLEENYAFVKERVQTDTVLSIAKFLIELYLNSNHNLPESIVSNMERIVTEEMTDAEKIRAINQLSDSFGNWQRTELRVQGIGRLQPYELIRIFTKYMQLAGIHPFAK